MSRLLSVRPVTRVRALVAEGHGWRVPLFLMVGVMGLIATNSTLAVLHGRLHVVLPVSAAAGWEVGMFVTFALNCRFTWRNRTGESLLKRLRNYQACGLVGAGIYLTIELVATNALGIHYLISSLLGTGVAAIWNYLMYNLVVFRTPVSREPARPARAA